MNKALFWDFDGTLAHSDSLWTGSVHKAIKRLQPESPLTPEDIRPMLQTGFTWHTPEEDYTHLAAAGAWWERLFRHISAIFRTLGVDGETAEAASIMVRELVLDASNYTVYPDAAPALDACVKAGFHNFVLSNNYPELPDIIGSLGLGCYFSGYIVSASAGYEKPRREIFDAALAAAGYPQYCFMIGDNPVADIAGARAAGIPAILVHGRAECAADFVCENLADVPAALGILL